MSDQILRIFRNENFKRIYLKPITGDSDLSWKAKGIHTYLITRPDGWKFNRQDIINRSTDGKTAVKTGLGELKEQGYLEIENFQQNDGKWASVWKVAEDPEMLGNQTVSENPTTDTPITDNKPHSSKEVSSKEYSSNTYIDPSLEAVQEGSDAMNIYLGMFKDYVNGKHGNVKRETYNEASAILAEKYYELDEDNFISTLREFFEDESRSGLPKLSYFVEVNDRFFE